VNKSETYVYGMLIPKLENFLKANYFCRDKKLPHPPQVLLYFEVNVGGLGLQKINKRLPASIVML
jgi:hypothetical protein